VFKARGRREESERARCNTYHDLHLALHKQAGKTRPLLSSPPPPPSSHELCPLLLLFQLRHPISLLRQELLQLRQHLIRLPLPIALSLTDSPPKKLMLIIQPQLRHPAHRLRHLPLNKHPLIRLVVPIPRPRTYAVVGGFVGGFFAVGVVFVAGLVADDSEAGFDSGGAGGG